MGDTPTIEGLSAVTLGTHDMARAVAFYEALGFGILHGGPDASFTSFAAGNGFMNIIAQPKDVTLSWWGRAIFQVSDVEAMFVRAVEAGLEPETVPADAPWGERYFHLVDPDGHELSFARPLARQDQTTQ